MFHKRVINQPGHDKHGNHEDGPVKRGGLRRVGLTWCGGRQPDPGQGQAAKRARRSCSSAARQSSRSL